MITLASALSLLLRSFSGQVSSLRITNILLGLLALRRTFFFLTLLIFFFTLSLRGSFELFFDHSALPLTLSLATANILASER